MDLFKVQSVGDFESYEYVQYREAHSSSQYPRDLREDLRIKMTDRDLFSFPADSFLAVRYLIDQDAVEGTAMPSTARVAPVNNGWSMFRRADLLLGDESAEEIKKPGYVCQIKSLLEFTDDYSRGQGKLIGYAPDSHDGEFAGRVTLGVVDGNGKVIHFNVTTSGANPHVVQLVSQTVDGKAYVCGQEILADDTPVNFYYQGQLLQAITKAAGDHVPINIPNFTLNGVVSPQTIDGVGLADGLVVEFYLEGNKIDITAETDNFGYFVSTAVPILTFNDGGAVAGTELRGVPIEGIANDGYEERRESALGSTGTTSKAICRWMPVRMLWGLYSYNPMLMKGLEQELVFDIDTVKQWLHKSPATALANIALKELSWWIPIVRPSLEIKNAFLKVLNDDTPIKLEWLTHNHYSSTQSDQAEDTWDIKSTEHRPERCFVWFQKASTINNQNANPYKFDNYGLTRISINAGSDRQFPSKDYVINYKEDGNRNYMRVYAAYLNACGLQHSEQCTPAVSYEEFAALYPFYVFDMRAQDPQVWEATSVVDLSVSFTLDSNEITRLGRYLVHAVLETRRKLDLVGANSRISRIQ